MSQLAESLAEQARRSALELADRQAIRERDSAEQRQKLAEKLAEDRGRAAATLDIWQKGIDHHNEKQNGKLAVVEEEMVKLRQAFDTLVTTMTVKAESQVTTLEFRKWAAGFILTLIGLYFANGGHIG